MKKILILELDNEYSMLKNTDICDYQNYFKYSNKNYLQKVLKKTKMEIAQFFLGEWKKNVQNYSIFILFDRGFNKNVSKYIKRKNPKAKVCLWLWNPVGERQKKFMKDENIDEIWTYDKNDSLKYNIKFNTQFYNNDFLKYNTNKEIKYDTMYIGNDKGRKEIIEKYNEQFKNIGLSTFISVKESKNENISYKEYLSILQQSKSVFEIVLDEVCGLTLRSLESIFFEKKLITNNKNIKNYKFYNPKNIFILEENNIDDLSRFLKEDYNKLDNDIINYYEFNEWVKRFI